MKSLFRLCGLCVLCLWLPVAWGQLSPTKITRIDIKHIGPSAVSDQLIRDNTRVKPGDVYQPLAVDDDVRSLYATGFFYNIRVAAERTDDGGLVLTYVVQANPRLTDIKIQGNDKFSESKVRKKITSKVGEPLNEQKLFSDTQAIRDAYEKGGYPGTKVECIRNIDELTGRGTATFKIEESPKKKIARVDFIGAQAFTPKQLRKQVKTRKRWMFSWLTGSGVYKEDQLEEDRDKLTEFYRNKGYIDFEIRDVKLEHPAPKKLVVRFDIYEGQQYKVGAVTFSGTTMFPTNQVNKEFKLKPGAVFDASQLSKDTEKVEDFYGAKGYIDVTPSTGNLRVNRIPNTDTGTMDLEYKVDEGQRSYVEKIEIRGNTKTKDKVIRRELAVSPGEVFDMVRVKVSKQRLEGLQYFEKVDARPEPTDVPNRKNLVIGVEEKNTGNLTFGAGFSSVDALVGYVEVSQGNFDLFHPPTFTGGGQKIRLRAQLGTERQDYILSFIEPWFLGRKLALGVEFYHRKLDYQSEENLYNEARTGARVSLTRALWSDFLIGSVSYTVESVGIVDVDWNAPPDIKDAAGYSTLSRFGSSLAYDTRNSTALPDAGQRTELFGEAVVGGAEFYKMELKSSWYFRGLFKGHVLELVGRTGVADGFSGGPESVPFYDRWYLGGLGSLRGFHYRDVGPQQPLTDGSGYESIGGNTYWFGCAEYSIPIVQKERGVGVRFAVFYDIGMVYPDAYSFTPQSSRGPGYDTGTYNDNWGIGLRLNLPIGPLRLDYAVPMTTGKENDGSGRFQFGAGYTRDF